MRTVLDEVLEFEGGGVVVTNPLVIDPREDREKKIVKWLILKRGMNDQRVLTDYIFHRRHPELNGRPIDKRNPNFKALAEEWNRIQRAVVFPTWLTARV